MAVKLHIGLLRSFRTAHLAAAVAGLLLPVPVVAQGWSTDPSQNTAVAPQAHDQQNPRVINDGSGGAIVVWQDYRNSGISRLYAQRYNLDGIKQWTDSGVAVADEEIWNQFNPEIIADGTGGCIIAWTHQDNNLGADVYAQRIDSTGNRTWGASGVVVSDANRGQYSHDITPDGAGGAIITWQDQRVSLDNTQIYAQHISSAGQPLWIEDGAPVCVAQGGQTGPSILHLSNGESIVAWGDSRGDHLDVYAQKLDASGAAQWALDGIAISTATLSQYKPQLVTDGAGGAILSWEDSRLGGTAIFAARVTATGEKLWEDNGVRVSTSSLDQDLFQVITDGSGGAIYTWDEYGTETNSSDVMAQKLGSTGSPDWTTSGVVVCQLPDEQQSARLCSNGAGGAIVVWADQRSGSQSDLYAQNLSAAGEALWAANGTVVSNATGSDLDPEIAHDNSGGAYIAWRRFANSTNNIFAQRISSLGGLGSSPAAVKNWNLFE